MTTYNSEQLKRNHELAFYGEYTARESFSTLGFKMEAHNTTDEGFDIKGVRRNGETIGGEVHNWKPHLRCVNKKFSTLYFRLRQLTTTHKYYIRFGGKPLNKKQIKMLKDIRVNYIHIPKQLRGITEYNLRKCLKYILVVSPSILYSTISKKKVKCKYTIERDRKKKNTADRDVILEDLFRNYVPILPLDFFWDFNCATQHLEPVLNSRAS